MEQYNQYYSDVVVNGKILNDKIFKGSQVYNKNFNVNSYNKYNGPGYYSWINENFKESILDDLKLEIIKRVGNLPLDFEIVNEIKRDPNTGKIRCVISEIK